MANKIKRGPNGVKVLNTPGQVNPIAREPHDNTTDLEQAAFSAQSRRKFTASDSSSPGKKVVAPPFSQSSLPG